MKYSRKYTLLKEVNKWEVYEWLAVDLFSHYTCKRANVNHRHTDNNKTANSKYKRKTYQFTTA